MIAAVRTLSVLYESHYLPAKHKNRSPATAEFFRTKIRMFEAYLGGPVDVRYLRTEHIDAYIASRKCSVQTLNGDLRVLLALMKFARKRGYRKGRIIIDMQPETLDDPEAWSADELREILHAVAKLRGSILGVPSSLWWTCLLIVVICTGSRISAIMRLRVDDYDFATGILRRRGSTQKQRASQSDALPPLVRVLIERFIQLRPDRAQLFPWPFDAPRITSEGKPIFVWGTLRKRYRKILKSCKLANGRKEMFHKIRKSSATFIAAAADEETTRRFLGHSDPSVTRRYIDNRKIAPPQVSNFIPWDLLMPPKVLPPDAQRSA